MPIIFVMGLLRMRMPEVPIFFYAVKMLFFFALVMMPITMAFKAPAPQS
jgi:hypothetical protein